MCPEVFAGQLGEFRATSTADGGTALSTTATHIQFPALTKAGDSKKCHLFITPRNFATAVVAKFAVNPWLTVLKTTDSGATYTDYSIEAQDNSTSTDVTLSSLDTEANGDWLLVGSHIPFGGVTLDVDSTNSTGSRTLTIAYANKGKAWTSYSLTYSVAWTTAFDADTAITWTADSNWGAAFVKDLFPYTGGEYFTKIPLFWTKWTVSGALDSSTTLNSMLSANAGGAVYGELLSGQALEQVAKYGFTGFGNVAALTNAGTANLIVNVATMAGGEF